MYISGRRTGESVLCGFETKDLPDMIWPHLVVSVLVFALFETSPSQQCIAQFEGRNCDQC